MNGLAELAQLAHLLRSCADTATNIAWLRPKDADRLLPMSKKAHDMAEEVDVLMGQQGLTRR